MSVSVLLLWLSIVAITQFFPMLMEAIGGAYTYWIFMINALILLIFIWKSLPETKGKSLEEIEKSWKHNHEAPLDGHSMVLTS